MSSQYPYDQDWANRSNVPPQQDGQLHGSSVHSGNWPSQAQPNPYYHSQQQQTYLNNNVAVKPPGYGQQPPPMQASWNRVVPPQPAFQPQPHNQFGGFQNMHPYPPQVQTPTNISPVMPNSHPSQMPPTVYQAAPPPVMPMTLPPPAPLASLPQPASNDHWDWGVEDSSSDSPATSTPNNNWTSQPTPSLTANYSVQNYFQPAAGRPGPEIPGAEVPKDVPKDAEALTVENVAVVDSRSEISTVKSESVYSYQSGSTASEMKPERLSPDPAKIPLTTQALREFHKEVYENGPSSHRLGMEGLTPQWSIESQMSQETMSDDVSPSMAGGSDADSTPLPVWQGEHQQVTPRRNNDADQRLQSLRLEETDRRFQPPPSQQYQQQVSQPPIPYQPFRDSVQPPMRNDAFAYAETSSSFSSLTLTDSYAENKEVISPDQQRANEAAQSFGDHSDQNGFRTVPGIEMEFDIRGSQIHSEGDGSADPIPSPIPADPMDSLKSYERSGSSPRPSVTISTPPINRPPDIEYRANPISAPSPISRPEIEYRAMSGPPLSRPSETDYRANPISAPPPISRPEMDYRAMSVPPVSRPPETDFRTGPISTPPFTRPTDTDLRSISSDFRAAPISVPPLNRPPPSHIGTRSDMGPSGAEQSFAPPPLGLNPYGLSSPSLPSRSLNPSPPSAGRGADSYPHSYRSNVSEDSANMETIPDNKERPDLEMRASKVPPPQQGQWYGSGIENLEHAPRGDRNQYLETGQLADLDVPSSAEAGIEVETGEGLPPPGLSRLVTGGGHSIDILNDTSTPPPGLDRMVLGQINESESSSMLSTHQGTPPPVGLHRMVVGQLNDEPARFPRMVPGESSSPENQVQSLAPVDVQRQRVVTGESSSADNPPLQSPVADAGVTRVIPGVARDSTSITSLPIPPPPVGRGQSPEAPSRSQPQAERCETIGSDHVEAYTAPQPDLSSSKPPKRRSKGRHRKSGDERESERRLHDDDYYRDGDDRTGSDRKKRDRDRDRDRRVNHRHEPHSPQQYESPANDRHRPAQDWNRHNSSYHKRSDQEYSDDDYDDDDEPASDGDSNDRDMSYQSKPDRSYSQRDDRDKLRKRTDERRDKDKRHGYRERDRNRERDPRHDNYWPKTRNDYDDYYEQRSRPPSRNDSSIHEGKHRSRDSGERHHYRSHPKRDQRDPYYQQPPGGAGYNYDPAMLNFYYQQYYENLRRSNPAAYAELYRKYYAPSQQGTYSEDRGSVHSGQSSANEDTKDRAPNTRKCTTEPPILVMHPYYLPQSNVVYGNKSPFKEPMKITRSTRGDRSPAPSKPQEPERMTPTKFTTAHAKGVLTTRGQLLHVLPHYPLDGQPAAIEVHEELSCYQDMRAQLQEFPGPLIKGVTHKNNVVRYCKQKIKDADNSPDLIDKESYKLIWELLILLLRQNGTVVGTDIAELLMAHRSAYEPEPSPATSHHSINEIPGQQKMLEDDVTNKFREMLIYGNAREALEWAMKHGLWGHALFLASKMDQRTYASVMARFANGLPLNDPLQTLYQLMSGRQPAAVTCCQDERWGDWRPHLAMILSNPSGRVEVDHRAIAVLGDTLGARGALYASQFCYLMAQLEFGSYAHKSSKIVLIGSSHNLPFHLFATNEAIFATEIFEFACNLADSEFTLHHLQIYKLLVARRLAEVGLTQEAVHYAEVISNTLMKQPSLYPAYFVQEVYDLGDMLKFSDPVFTSSDNSGADPPWLQQLQAILSDYQSGVLQHDVAMRGSTSNLTTFSGDGHASLPVEASDQSWQQPEPVYNSLPPQPHQQQQQNSYQSHYQPQQHFEQPPPPIQTSMPPQSKWSQEPVPTPQTEPYIGGGDQQSYGRESSTETPNYWTPSSPNQWQPPMDDIPPSTVTSPLPGSAPGQISGDYYESSRSEAPPTISLPNDAPRRQRTTSQSSDTQTRAPRPSPPTRNDDLPNLQPEGSGWFGGLWNKFSRNKAQTKPMILPDDKNPSIVWDTDQERWVDQNADPQEEERAFAPPPMMLPRSTGPAPLPPNATPLSSANASNLPMPPSMSAPNLYKMARGKSLRANYVNVMNTDSKAQPAMVPPPDLFPSLSYSNQPKLLIPSPVDGHDNSMNMSGAPQMDQPDTREPPSQGLSRWSSASSLSREVQKYTTNHKDRFKMSGYPGGYANNVGQWNSENMGGTLPRVKRSYK